MAAKGGPMITMTGSGVFLLAVALLALAALAVHQGSR
jgi:hypothetical protein